MHPVAIIFGAACGGGIAFSGKGDRVRHTLSWMMLAVWGAANLLWLHDHMEALALFDLPIALLAFAMLCAEQRNWQLAVTIAFAFRLTLHIPGAWGMIPRDLYLHWINAAFLAALIAISWEGGKRVATDTVDRVRRIRSVGRKHAAADAVVASQ